MRKQRRSLIDSLVAISAGTTRSRSSCWTIRLDELGGPELAASTSTDDGLWPPGARTGRARRVRLAAARPVGLVRQEPSTPVRARSQALVVPAILPGDIATRSGARGPHRREHGGQPHIPTATSMRLVPVRTLEENRRVLNKHRDATAQQDQLHAPRGVAILRALDTFPRLNDATRVQRGAPCTARGALAAGRRPARTAPATGRCSCPTSRTRTSSDIAGFLKAFDTWWRGPARARSAPTTSSAPPSPGPTPAPWGRRPASAAHARAGLIVATGALDYPAEYRSMAPRTLSLLGIQQVMTVTSTTTTGSSRRGVGLFLVAARGLLKAREDGFYERIFETRTAPDRALRSTSRRGLFAPRARSRSRSRPASCSYPRLSSARPSRHRPRSPRFQARAAQGPRSRHLRPDAVGPRPGVLHQRAVGPRTARRWPRSGDPARHVLRNHRRRVHVHRGPRAQGVAADRMRMSRNRTAFDCGRAPAHPSRAGGGRELRRFLHAK